MKREVKKKNVWLFCCILTVCMLFLCACGGNDSEKSIRVGSLKGPTTIGIVNYMNDCETAGNSSVSFDMEVAADTLATKLLQGELDIVMVPSNVAANLYAKTGGKIRVLDINTLGVLYLVSGDNTVTDIASLKGKTVYLTGMGTTPDYVLQSLLDYYQIGDNEVTLEYKSEPTEVAALLSENPDCIGLLPQPFVTALLMKNENLGIVADMNDMWEQTGKGSIVTGVTICTEEYLNNNKDAVDEFIEEHAKSAETAVTDISGTADLIVKYGIIENSEVAENAILKCGTTCISGDETAGVLNPYLNALYEINPEFVGGELPGNDFYYIPE